MTRVDVFLRRRPPDDRPHDGSLHAPAGVRGGSGTADGRPRRRSEPLPAGSTLLPSARPAREPCTSWRRSRRTAFRASARSCAASARLRCGAASPTGTRCGRMREIVRGGGSARDVRRGGRGSEAEVPGPVQPGAAMVAIHRRRAREPRRDPREPDMGVPATSRRCRSLGGADDLRGAPARRTGLQGGVRAAPGGDPPPLGLAGRDPRARAAGRRPALGGPLDPAHGGHLF